QADRPTTVHQRTHRRRARVADPHQARRGPAYRGRRRGPPAGLAAPTPIEPPSSDATTPHGTAMMLISLQRALIGKVVRCALSTRRGSIGVSATVLIRSSRPVQGSRWASG